MISEPAGSRLAPPLSPGGPEIRPTKTFQSYTSRYKHTRRSRPVSDCTVLKCAKRGRFAYDRALDPFEANGMSSTYDSMH
jgi:hypothetical protein